MRSTWAVGYMRLHMENSGVNGNIGVALSREVEDLGRGPGVCVTLPVSLSTCMLSRTQAVKMMRCRYGWYRPCG